MEDVDWEKVFAAITEDVKREWEAGNKGAGAYGGVHILRALGVDADIDLHALAEAAAAMRAMEYGPAAKVFGPVSLHPVAYVLNTDERREQPWYQLLPSGHDTPVVIPSTETATNSGAIIALNILGAVPIETSGVRDVIRHLRKQQLIGAVGAAFYREADGRHPELAEDSARWLATAMQREHRESEALRGLATLYPEDAASADAQSSKEEEEHEAAATRKRLAGNESLQVYARERQRQMQLGTPPEPPREETAE